MDNIEKFLDSEGKSFQAKRVEDKNDITSFLSGCDQDVYAELGDRGIYGDIDHVMGEIYSELVGDDTLQPSYSETHFQETKQDNTAIVDFVLIGADPERGYFQRTPLRTEGRVYVYDDEECRQFFKINKIERMDSEYDPLTHYRRDEISE